MTWKSLVQQKVKITINLPLARRLEFNLCIQQWCSCCTLCIKLQGNCCECCYCSNSETDSHLMVLSVKVRVQKLSVTMPWRYEGAFAKLQKDTISFIMSVSPSIPLSTWNNSASTGWTVMKFDIWVFFKNMLRKFKFH